MGGSKVQNTSPAPAPTTSDATESYIKNLPKMYEAQLQYSPLMNQQDYEQTAIYAPLMQKLQESMYPNVSAVPEKIAQVAMQNVGQGMPQYMRDSYLDQFRAEIGTNAGSGIGADYVSRNMTNQNEQYKQYYNNLALSVAGMQPLTQSSQWQQAYSPMQTYTYGQVANNMMQGYGSYASSQASMYGSAAQLSGAKSAANGQMIGSAAGMIGTIGAGVAI